jgi:hypothetical protein
MLEQARVVPALAPDLLTYRLVAMSQSRMRFEWSELKAEWSYRRSRG